MPAHAGMLSQGEHAVAYCYQCALEAKRLASREHDPKLKEEYLERMRRWVEVAESYEFADRLAMLANSEADSSTG